METIGRSVRSGPANLVKLVESEACIFLRARFLDNWPFTRKPPHCRRHPSALGLAQLKRATGRPQAGQQKSRTEVAPVDAPVNDRCASPNTLAPQRHGQILIAPPPVAHRLLDKAACRHCPDLHGIGLGGRNLQQRGNGNRPTRLGHFVLSRKSIPEGARELESILTHIPSRLVYLHSTTVEVRNA